MFPGLWGVFFSFPFTPYNNVEMPLFRLADLNVI